MRPFLSTRLLFVAVFAAAFILQLVFPWWIVVVVGLAAGLISPLPAWKSGFVVLFAIGLLWLGAAAYMAMTESAVLLPRMATLLYLPAGWMLFVATPLVGALPSALPAMGGRLLIEHIADDQSPDPRHHS